MRLHARIQKLERCIQAALPEDPEKIRIRRALQTLSTESLQHLTRPFTGATELTEAETNAVQAFNEAFAAMR